MDEVNVNKHRASIVKLNLIDDVKIKQNRRRSSVATNNDSANNTISTKFSIEKKNIFTFQRGSIPDVKLNVIIENDPNIKRRDAYGIPILKGCKKHKVTFIDNISRKKIAEQILILPFAELKKNQKVSEKCVCECTIF